MKNVPLVYAVFRILAGLGPRGESPSRRLQRFSQNTGLEAVYIRNSDVEETVTVPTG